MSLFSGFTQSVSMQRLPSLYIASSPLGGRGVFTAEHIPEGSLIEICPVIIISKDDCALIHQTHLHDYYFLWGEQDQACALALGYGSLYNHSFEPNAEYSPDYENDNFEFYALSEIKAGNEVTVNYNGEPGEQDSLWFEAKKS
jgi:SET domain-containing protein